jgi:hypothetical protein
MADYWGWTAIQERMGGYCERTLRFWRETRGFPVIMARKPHGIDPHRRWAYTNDEMIIRWQLAQAAQQRRERIQKREERLRAKSSAPPIAPSVKPMTTQVDTSNQP